jgi:pimeloyl-ACP methyl ester carboxylesterase
MNHLHYALDSRIHPPQASSDLVSNVSNDIDHRYNRATVRRSCRCGGTLDSDGLRRAHDDHRLTPRREVRLGDWVRRANPRLQWSWHARRLDYRARLNEVAAPTLVIAGRHDPQTRPSVNEEVARGLPYGRLVLFEQSGHYPWLEEPERFWPEVGAFLSGISPRKKVA